MLNIGRMAPGSHDYYLSVVADGAEDYYLRRGEAPGRWLGREVERLGLEGRVEADQLRRVLAGDRPHRGERLATHPARKVPGFDLTFRAPKSVSLMWAFGDRQVAAQVLQAHEAAVAAAIGYMEREAARTRRGAGGTERVQVDGLIAAAFPHRTSRAGDPLLHTHVLVANLAHTCDDDKWRTLESRRLFLHAKTAGFLYQAHLRHELSVRLGVGWDPVVNGLADIEGIPRQLIEHFSQRRKAILAHLEERGESSAKAAQVATLATRAGKDGHATELELRRKWAEQARSTGFDPNAIARVVGRHRPQTPNLHRLVAELVDEEELTQRAATFTRRDVLQAVAERLTDGAPVCEVERVADGVVHQGRDRLVSLGPRRGQLAAVDVIRLSDGRIVAGDEEEPRMTTRRLLAVEQQAINSCLARQREGIGLVPRHVVDEVLAARPTMTAEQADMVRRLTGDGEGVTVVLGRAGTGKTFSLDAARDAWQSAGTPVRGVALAARAARELEEAAGIRSTTIHRLLAQIGDPRLGSPLRPGSVLVVDEAGMVGTRQLARLLHYAHTQRVKVVLVGDPRQLPEIDAGGLFGHLIRRLDVVQLIGNRRQTAAWEIEALDELRDGDPAAALDLYDEHGRVISADTAEALREQLVSDWWHAHHQVGARESVMIALRQSDVDDLNHRARACLHAAGLLEGPVLEVDGRQFQPGDRILCLRNDRRVGVVNGSFATVEAVDTQARALAVRGDDGTRILLPARYLDARHVTHGYAITGHKAQGLTVEHTFVLGSDRLYREWSYVAMSRGRTSNQLYVHPAATDPHGLGHGPQLDVNPHAQTAAGLRRSRAQTPAAAYVDEAEGAALGVRWRNLRGRLQWHEQRRAELSQRYATLTRQRRDIEDDVAQLEERRADLGGLGRIRRDIRDEAARLDARLKRHRRDQQRLDSELDQVRHQLALLPDHEQLRPLREEHARAGGQLVGLIQARTAAAIHNPPGYLLLSIGRQPDSGPQRAAWRDAVRAVEHYRTCWGITDPQRPLGDQPSDPAMREDRQRAVRRLLDAIPHRQPVRSLADERTLHRSMGL